MSFGSTRHPRRSGLDLNSSEPRIKIRGESKAALEVAKRERIPTDGPKYAIYGVDEDALWDKIESMEGWWKDTTWKRLVLRELPDV